MTKFAPSLAALPGPTAIVGYQNRDPISQMLPDACQQVGTSETAMALERAGHLAGISQPFHAGQLTTSPTDLLEGFGPSGQTDAADSRVLDKANAPVNIDVLKAAPGAETLAGPSHEIGQFRNEPASRLNRALSDVVNRPTPNGRFPSEGQARTFG